MPTLAERLAPALAGRYTLTRQIGEGGMGTVFLATDLRHDRRVAIKVLRSEVAEAVGATRFAQEIKISAKLDHPHILMLIDSGEADGLLHYVMPFVDGESLRDRITREQRLPLGDALRIAAQVGDALDYAHKRGIIHRDIKPENILLADGHVKVADFGIARIASSDSVRLTQTGMSIGTPAYMSPEQLLADETLDGRSDLYSLGCVLYEMLTGAPPFYGTSMQAIMAKRITQDAERVSTLRANIPPMVDLVLARALARDPAERHASAGEFAAALLAEISGASAAAVPADSGAYAPSQRARLVGREKELGDARALLDKLPQGRGGLLLIGGEPGVGKTRLSQAILDDARSRGALCVTGHCYEMEGTPPYTPYAELLDVVARLIPARVFRDVLGDAAPEIARVQPSLRQTFPDIPQPLDLAVDRQRQHLHAKYREFNERAARISPIVVLLDDLHWADDASLALLEHSATYLDTLPIVVVGTYRDVDLDVNRGFARLLESLTRQRLAQRVALKRLPAERVAELLGALGGAAPPAELAKVIYDETDGNPFFVEEVFAHLKEEGRLFDAAGKWRTDLRVEDLDVPEGVRLVIGRRLERLTETCRTVLTSAAVIGPRFGLTVLEKLGEQSEDDLLDSLDAAVKAHLINEQRGGREVTYTFAHELIRQTLVSALSLPRRQRRHLKIAAAIELAAGSRVESRASDLAYHLYQAGAAADPDKTLRYLTLAADQAYKSAAYEESLAQCARADTIEDATDATALARLAQARAKALRGLGRWPEAQSAYIKALDLGIAAGEHEVVGFCGLEAAWMAGWAGDRKLAVQLLQRALASLPESHVASRSRLTAQMAGDAAGANLDYEGSQPLFHEAAALAAKVDDPTVAAYAWVVRAAAAFNFGRTNEAIEAGDKACAVLTDPAHRQSYLEARGFRHASLAYAGRWAEVRAERDELMRMAKEAGHVGALLLTDLGLLVAEHMQSGNLARQIDWADEAMVTWEAAGPWRFLNQVVKSFCFLARGELNEALAVTRAAQAHFPARIQWSGSLEGYENLVAAYLSDELWRECTTRHAHFTPTFAAMPTAGSMLYGTALARGYSVRGELEPLAALYPVFKRHVEGGALTREDLTEGYAGMCAAAGDDWAAAEYHFESAIALGERLQHRMGLPSARQWYAEMVLRRGATGDRARGRALLEQAVAEFRAIGANYFASRAEALL